MLQANLSAPTLKQHAYLRLTGAHTMIVNGYLGDQAAEMKQGHVRTPCLPCVPCLEFIFSGKV